jgi:hypothetical protein
MARSPRKRDLNCRTAPLGQDVPACGHATPRPGPGHAVPRGQLWVRIRDHDFEPRQAPGHLVVRPRLEAVLPRPSVIGNENLMLLLP